MFDSTTKRNDRYQSSHQVKYNELSILEATRMLTFLVISSRRERFPLVALTLCSLQ